MTGTRPGSRSHSRARDPRSRDPRARSRPRPGGGAQNPLVAAGQILLGLTLSCLVAALVFAALIGLVAAVVYLAK